MADNFPIALADEGASFICFANEYKSKTWYKENTELNQKKTILPRC